MQKRRVELLQWIIVIIIPFLTLHLQVDWQKVNLMMVMAVGLSYMAFLAAGSSVGQVALRIAIVGGGLGLFQASAYTLMMRSVPKERFGTAGAALSLSQAFGSVLAVAVVGGLFAWRGDHYRDVAEGLVNVGGIAFVKAFRDVFLLGAVAGLFGAVALLLGGRASNKE